MPLRACRLGAVWAHDIPELSDPTPTLTTMLTVRDHQTLQLAFAHFAYPAVRAARALDELGYSETRFWQVVRHLLEQPAAEAAYPADVRRLRRLHETRARQRSMRQVGCGATVGGEE